MADKLSPKEFATLLRAVQDVREDSYDARKNKYNKSFRQAARETCQEPWDEIIAVLLFPEYCDVWEWCDSVLGPVKPK